MTNMKTKTFTPQMTQFLELGAKNRKRLSILGNKISNFNTDDEYNHSYIYSVPGLGKTHTVNDAMSKNGINYATISGNVSMFAFGVQLALINYLNPNEVTVVSVDDCNEILKDTSNINIIKNILEGNRVFHYQKMLGGLISQLDELQQKAIQSHIVEGTTGFVVPTKNMVFVFTANERLPYDDEVNGKRVKDRLIHLNAIRNRCRVYDFVMEPMVQWGWISDVILNVIPPVVKVPNHIKEECCMFMYENWDNMKTKSIRTAKMMCEDYIKNKEDYQFIWESEYLK
jgi:hypothetical protein